MVAEIATVIIYVTGNTRFLSDFGAESIPIVYILMGVVVGGLFFGMAILKQRYSPLITLIIPYSVVLILSLASWLLLQRPNSEWVAFVLMLMFPMAVQIGSIALGVQAGQVLNIRQIKRYFPILFSWVLITFVITAALIPQFTEWVDGLDNLLLIAVATEVIAIGLAVWVQRLVPRTAAPQTNSADTTDSAPRIGRILANPYTRTLFNYQTLSAIGTQLIIYLFLVQADQAISNPDELAVFFSQFGGIRNLFNFVFTLLFAGPIISHFGLRTGITLNPLIVTLGIVVLLIMTLVEGSVSLTLFWLTIGLYTIDMMLSDGITSTAIKTAYQPLPASERGAVESIVEGIGVPSAIAFTGVLLLIVNAVPAIDTIHVIVITLLICLLWLAAGWRAYSAYGESLTTALRRRALPASDLLIDDNSTLAIVEQLVQSNKLREVRLGFDMLAEADHPAFGTHVQAALFRSNAAIQQEALQRIETHKITVAQSAVSNCLTNNQLSADVQNAAIQTLWALDSASAAAQSARFLKNGAVVGQRGALIGQLRYGDAPAQAQAAAILQTWTAAPTPDQRLNAAHVLSKATSAEATPQLTTLLNDPSFDVRQAALAAVSSGLYPNLSDELAYTIINQLEPRRVRSAAVAALVALPDAVLTITRRELQSNNRLPQRHLITLLRVCESFEPDLVISSLREFIMHQDAPIRARLWSTLAHHDIALTEAEQTQLHALARDLGRCGYRHLLAKARLAEALSAEHVLIYSIHTAIEQIAQQFEALLAIQHDAATIYKAMGKLRSPNKGEQALALEMLDVLFNGELRTITYPFLKADMPLKEKISALASVYRDERPPSLEFALATYLNSMETTEQAQWTKTCALHAVGELKLTSLRHAMILAIENGTEDQKVTGRHALYRLDHGTAHGEQQMLLKVEKVALLQSAEIFSNTPNHVLASIASVAEEVTFDAGDSFIEEGVIEDSMYLLIEGSVRVHRGDKTILTLDPVNTVGELAVLDPQPRAATVTTLEPTLLFRLHKFQIDELMADRPEIAQSIIRALVQRIRHQASSS